MGRVCHLLALLFCVSAHAGCFFDRFLPKPKPVVRQEVLDNVRASLASQWVSDFDSAVHNTSSGNAFQVTDYQGRMSVLWDEARAFLKLADRRTASKSIEAEYDPTRPLAATVAREKTESREEITFSRNPSSLVFNRDSFDGAQVSRQRPDIGSIASGLSGGQLGSLASTLYEELVLSATRGKPVNFHELEKQIDVRRYRVETKRGANPEEKWVYALGSNEPLFGVLNLANSFAQVQQVVLPTPGKLPLLTLTEKNRSTNALVLTLLRKDSRAPWLVSDIKPLADDISAGGTESLKRLIANLDFATHRAERDKLERMRAELAQTEATAKRPFFEPLREDTDYEIRYASENRNMLISAVGSAVAVAALTFATWEPLLGVAPIVSIFAPIPAWGAATMLAGTNLTRANPNYRNVFAAPMIHMARLRLPQMRAALAKQEELVKLFESSPSKRLQTLTAETAGQATLRPYRPTNEKLRQYWNAEEADMSAAERNQFAGLFRRSEWLNLGEAKTDILLREIAPRSSDGAKMYQLAFERGDTYIRRIETTHPKWDEVDVNRTAGR